MQYNSQCIWRVKLIWCFREFRRKISAEKAVSLVLCPGGKLKNLTTPILATVGLITGVAYWNDWTNGLYYITDEKLFSIQQLLNKMNENIQFLANNASLLGGSAITTTLPSATVRMAIAVVAILPVIIIYPFFQKYFAKGIIMGAVKG